MTATNYAGPYDVTDSTTWKAALDTDVQNGEMLEPVQYGNKVIFVRVT